MTIKIPLVLTQDRDLNLFQTQLGKALQPVLVNPLIEGNLITMQSLVTGANTINTGLNRPLQGWILVRVRAQATVWDSQDTNPTPDRTLILNASSGVSVDVWVF